MDVLLRKLLATGCYFYCACSFADGQVVDKVYHPYVDALETELEFRSVYKDSQPGIGDVRQLHQLAIGRALTDTLFTELYVIGTKNQPGGFSTEAWELEFKWQLSEQGEFWADYGLLFELENELHEDIKEVTVGLLAEKEFGLWSAAANVLLIREWGDDIVDEFETAAALQLRYRHSKAFEPAIEFYAGQDERGVGPVVQGTIDTGVRKSLHWEAGLILGFGKQSPDQTWRFLLEYEF